MWFLAFSLYAALNLVGTPTRRRPEDLALLEPDIEDAPDVSVLVDIPSSIAINYDSNFVSSISPVSSSLYAVVDFVSDYALLSVDDLHSAAANSSSSDPSSVHNVSSICEMPTTGCRYSQVINCDASPMLLSWLMKMSSIVDYATEQYHSLQSLAFWIVSSAIQLFEDLLYTSIDLLSTPSGPASITLVLLLYRFFAFGAVFGAFYRVRSNLRTKMMDGEKGGRNTVGKSHSPGHQDIGPLPRSVGHKSVTHHGRTSDGVRAVDVTVKGRFCRRSIGVQVVQYRNAATQTYREDGDVGINEGLVTVADTRAHVDSKMDGDEDYPAPTQDNHKGTPNDVTSATTSRQNSTSNRISSDGSLPLLDYPFSRSYLAAVENVHAGPLFEVLGQAPPDSNVAHPEGYHIVGIRRAPVANTSGSTISSEASLPLPEYLPPCSHSATVEPFRTSFDGLCPALPNVDVAFPGFVDLVVPNLVGHQAAVPEVDFLVKSSATSQYLARSVPEANALGGRPSLTYDGFEIISRAEACTEDAGVICPPRLTGHLNPSNIHAVNDPPSCGIKQPFVPIPRPFSGQTTPAEVPDPPIPEGDEDEKLNTVSQEGHATGVPQSVDYAEDFTAEVAKYSPLEARDPVIVVKRVLHLPMPTLGRRVWVTDLFATYSYEKLLGAGAYGSVSRYAVVTEHQRMPKVVAVKRMKHDRLAENELDLTKVMNWSHWVVMVFGGFVYKDEMFMVMHSYAGTLLDINVQVSTFPRDLAIFYVAEIVVALRDLHRSRIIHRDVKPENIFITPSNHLAIGDFGMAHQFAIPSQDLMSSPEFSAWTTAYLENQARVREAKPDTFTFPFLWAEDNPWTVNIPCGTSVYAAPEVMRSEYHSFGADLYSVGVITHLLLCGKSPYADLANVETHPGDAESRVLRLDESLTSAEKDFITRMMDSSAENRLSYEQIHEHWIFETIDWEAVEHQTVAPPFEEYYDILDDERAKRAQAIAPTPVLPPISLGPGIDSSSSSVF